MVCHFLSGAEPCNAMFGAQAREFSGSTRYNFCFNMQKRRYALVAYLKSPAGEFVESLRRELHPDLPHLAAHLTILPPRLLQGTENAALQVLERICGEEEPFEVTLGCVETFVPITPTIFIRIDAAASHMSELHRKLNIAELQFQEEWPYIPHLTIAKMGSEGPAKAAFEIARQRWEEYAGSRRILLEKLTFVREDSPNCWVDLAPVQLGRRLVSH
jgi:2'-5' RNA ligase